MEQEEAKLSDDYRNVCVVPCNIRSIFYDGFLLSQL